MARFEMTLSTGETILVDHVATGMDQILAELTAHPFVLFSEVKGGSSSPAREVIVATSQIAIVRPLHGESRQGSSFVPKR